MEWNWNVFSMARNVELTIQCMRLVFVPRNRNPFLEAENKVEEPIISCLLLLSISITCLKIMMSLKCGLISVAQFLLGGWVMEPLQWKIGGN